MLNSLTNPSYPIAKSPVGLDVILNPFELYTIPLDNWINAAVNFIVDNFRPIFQAIRVPIKFALDFIEAIFQSIPPLIFLMIIGLMAWQLAGGKTAIYSIAALTLIGFVGAWKEAMVTLSLVVTAVAFCVAIGVPLGIACARSDRLVGFVRPLLDIMQTIPIFVYLVPVVMLFGIGKVPGTIATIVFALPPLIRLTNLGIRQVSFEVVEAAIAFGSTPWQVLWEAQIPLAMPTILTGLNQTILFALGMSVVTSMIAVPGLGLMVLQGVGRLDVGLAAVGGLGIVLLAIMLDRITQAVGKVHSRGSWLQRGPIGFLFSRLRVKRGDRSQQIG
ncbi:MAG: ABC transporter permease subunit [Microcoleus sp. SU_5_3]|nr:ABC transporter permease subunit [Microcoleus sp. SU_5_3]NJL66108.1 ABC transporter permease subunit [Microcoleus sp. SM1_3_4]